MAANLIDRSSFPLTAFVLAGGGTLGAVEVGMLETLSGYGLVPDLIVGSSAGAINGAYFAGAPDPEGVARLAGIWRRLRRDDVFPFSPLEGFWSLLRARNHLVDPGRLRCLLETHLPYRDLSDARVPFHVVATNILTGAEVTLSSGSVVDAVIASASIPGVYPPVEMGGCYLVDGGIANNTPVSTAVRLGAEKVVVLPAGFSCDIAEPPRSAIAMALHGLTLLIARQLIIDIERFNGMVRLHVVPPLCPLKSTPADFSAAAELIERAAESTRTWLDSGGLRRTEIPDHLRPHSHG